MNFRVLMYLLGRLTLVMGVSLIVPFTYSLRIGDGAACIYFVLALFTCAAAGLLFYGGRKHRQQLGLREAAWFTLLMWIWMSCGEFWWNTMQ